MGRLFDGCVLDMMEFGVDPNTWKSISEFSAGRGKVLCRTGSTPMMVFNGEVFGDATDSPADFSLLKSLFLDFFRVQPLEKVNLASLDRVIVVTYIQSVIYFRQYAVSIKRNATKPETELVEVGPRLDLTLRRTKTGSHDLKLQSMRKPRVLKTKENKEGIVSKSKQKNIEADALGDKMGRVHIGKQDLSQLVLKNMKGLQKKRKRPTEKGEKKEKGEKAGEEESGEKEGE